MKPSQRKALYSDPSLVILELTGPVDFARSTYYALPRADADASAARAVRRGQSALIHYREGTVTLTPEVSP